MDIYKKLSKLIKGSAIMKVNFFNIFGLLLISSITYAKIECENLVKIPYNSTPNIYAPKETLGQGIRIWKNGKLIPIPDTRPACLPIALRLNNPGALKTKKAVYWKGQISKDKKGHAVFATVEDGVSAMGEWFKTKYNSGKKYTAYDIMSIYAPPAGCVGDVGTPPDHCTYGLNPTKEYATRIANSVNKKYNEPLNLNGSDCKEGREAMYALISEIATFEIGGNFCGKESKKSLASCSIDRDMFDRSMDKVFGTINYGQCSDPASAHENE